MLSAVDVPERSTALAPSTHAWRGDPLVLDKWFSIQAFSPLPGTVDGGAGVDGHPDFDLRNPNRVRALIGSFRRQPGAIP